MRVVQNYLSPDSLKSLQEYIDSLTLFGTSSNNNYNDADKDILAFSGTYRFSEDKEDLYNRFPGFKQYIETIVDDDCNVFHFVCLKSGVGMSIPWHVDDDIKDLIQPTTQVERAVYQVPWEEEHPINKLRIVSKHTTVLYVDVPEDMKGGELHICLAIGREAVEGIDDKIIEPETNMLVKFDGAHYHQVLEITEGSRERVAIVCEQYKLSKRNLQLLPTTPIVSEG